jgi:hypothetical protein
MHWHDTVSEIRARKLELARLDPRGGMPIQPPTGASQQDIARAERRLGRPLPPSYRAFLAAQDGWPRFFLGAALLGVQPLSRGTYVDVARMVIDDGELAGPSSGAAPGTSAPAQGRVLVPFGIDAEAETVFAWDLGAPRADGELGVLVWTNEVGLHVDDFPSFLELCLDMLRAEIEERRATVRRPPVSSRSPVFARRSRAA